MMNYPLTGDARVITNEGDRVMTPEQLGKRIVSPSDIYGGNSPEEASKIFLDILKGKGSWAQNAVVLANAAMALYCTGAYADYELGVCRSSRKPGKRESTDQFTIH